MPELGQEIADIREGIQRVLEDIGLRAFAFTAEHKEGGWSVHVECDTGAGWQVVTLPVEAAEVRASLRDAAVRDRLRAQWDARLRACARRDPPAWEHFDHGADIGVRGFGASKAEAFEQAAMALTAVVTDPGLVSPRERIAIECAAADDELLFAEWLNALIYEMSARKMLFSRFAVRLDPNSLKADAWGERVDPTRHHPAVEVKGATYTALRVALDNGRWVAQTVVDV
jgi:SHS2 domain-containing protein